MNTETIFTVVDVSKFTRVCQYSSTLLNCPTGSVIKIQRGFWGRKQRDVCRFVSIIDCGLDTVPTVTKKLRQQCDGSWSCKVEASNDPKHFGNPCLGVYKYLEVNYTCVHPGIVFRILFSRSNTVAVHDPGALSVITDYSKNVACFFRAILIFL